jgi:hypothetical protein
MLLLIVSISSSFSLPSSPVILIYASLQLRLWFNLCQLYGLRFSCKLFSCVKLCVLQAMLSYEANLLIAFLVLTSPLALAAMLSLARTVQIAALIFFIFMQLLKL